MTETTTNQNTHQLLVESSRIREDLMKAVSSLKPISLSIVIREFLVMDPALEFRGFVYKNQLTALTQYCYHQYFEKLQDPKFVYVVYVYCVCIIIIIIVAENVQICLSWFHTLIIVYIAKYLQILVPFVLQTLF